MIAAPKATRCFHPPGRLPVTWSSLPSRPENASAQRAFSTRSCSSTPYTPAKNSRFWRIVRSSYSENLCDMYPICCRTPSARRLGTCRRDRSEEHTSELQSLRHLVCRLLLEKKKKTRKI